MRCIFLQHNDNEFSAPYDENSTMHIILSRHPDGSMDIYFSGKKNNIREVWYYNDVYPGDKLIISQKNGNCSEPKQQEDYHARSELNSYHTLHNSLTSQNELYSNIDNLGIELCLPDGNFTGFLKGRVVTLTVCFIRGKIITQFGALDSKTFELFTWYYNDEGVSIDLSASIKKVENDSMHLIEFPKKMKPPTPKELVKYKKLQEKQYLEIKKRLKINDLHKSNKEP